MEILLISTPRGIWGSFQREIHSYPWPQRAFWSSHPPIGKSRLQEKIKRVGKLGYLSSEWSHNMSKCVRQVLKCFFSSWMSILRDKSSLVFTDNHFSYPRRAADAPKLSSRTWDQAFQRAGSQKSEAVSEKGFYSSAAHTAAHEISRAFVFSLLSHLKQS